MKATLLMTDGTLLEATVRQWYNSEYTLCVPVPGFGTTRYFRPNSPEIVSIHYHEANTPTVPASPPGEL